MKAWALDTKRDSTFKSGNKVLTDFGVVVKNRVPIAIFTSHFRDLEQLCVFILHNIPFYAGRSIPFRLWHTRTINPTVWAKSGQASTSSASSSSASLASSASSASSISWASSRRLSSDALELLHRIILKIMRDKPRRAPGFSISFDAWSSRGMTKSLMAVTYHFFDTLSWKLDECVMDAIPLPANGHSAIMSADLVADRIQRHSTASQFLFMGTTDNAAAAVKSCKLLMAKLNIAAVDGAGAAPRLHGGDAVAGEGANVELEIDLTDGPVGEDDDDDLVAVGASEEDGDQRSFGCVAHLLHLAVKKALKDSTYVSAAIARAHSLAVAVRASVQRKKKLREIQVALGARQLAAVIDMPTRWNSTLAMLTRHLLIRDSLLVMIHLGELKNSDGVSLEPTSEMDVIVIRTLRELLQPVEAFSKRVQTSRSPLMASLVTD